MSNPNGKSPQDSYLKTKKKGNVTVNPKKEDLMSELFQKNLRNALQEIKQQAKQSIKEAPAASSVNTTSQKEAPGNKKAAKKVGGDTGDVKPETPTCEDTIDDTQARKDIAERMRQRLLQLTQEHDSKYLTKQAYTQCTFKYGTMINFLMPIAISIINKAVDKIPDDLDSVIKDFVIKLLKKAAAKTENKLDDELVAAVAKALLESQCL